MIEKQFGNFTLGKTEDTPVLTLRGDIDISNVRQLRDALEQVDGENELFVVDLSAVDFLDSTALAALVHHRNLVTPKGTTVALVIASPLVQRIFDITNFNSQFTIVRRLQDLPGFSGKA